MTDLSFKTGQFDLVVSSLVLFYCSDLGAACRELRRVTKSKKGRLILALMPPYFYRMGTVTKDGSFLLKRDLSQNTHFEFKIGNQVGPLEYYYRSLPEYLNTLIKSGWEIEEVRDWFLDMNDYRRVVGKSRTDAPRRTGKIPTFTFIKCRAR